MQASSGVEIVATKTVACVADDRKGRERENFRRVTIRALSACFARVQARRLTGSFVHEEMRKVDCTSPVHCRPLRSPPLTIPTPAALTILPPPDQQPKLTALAHVGSKCRESRKVHVSNCPIDIFRRFDPLRTSRSYSQRLIVLVI